jgi:RecA-family ATPase
MPGKIDPQKIGDALLSFDQFPPVSSYNEDEVASNGHDASKALKPPEPPIEWPSLDGDPPPRMWWIQDWLGPWPTLTSGAGGAGKTRLWQAVATSLATGRPYLEAQVKPLRVLSWLCEETRDEVWRNQVAINRHFTLSMENLSNLSIVPRQGLENTLMAVVYGQPMFTPLLEQLRQQVNDLKVDVLVLDNLAQLFGGNENDRHQATFFVNAIAGIVRDRPFAPVFVGHTARAQGSEFSGSAAWENACRMRWYVGSTLPDQKPQNEDDPADTDVVYLARRKANYAPKDWMRLKYESGVLVPEGSSDAPADHTFRDGVADDLIIAAIVKLKAAGVHPTDGITSSDYLPKQIVAKRLAEGHSKRELAAAMNRLMGIGRLRRDIVGKYSNRSPRYGLVIV